jgi:hypothetical protein
MKRIGPKQAPLRPDGWPMTAEDFRTLHDKIAESDDLEWIDDDTREIVERFMPDLVAKLPKRRGWARQPWRPVR